MDARLFLGLALERGFVAPALLIGARATRAAVRAKIVEMAEVSEPGDLVLLTFSGHGGRTRLPAGEMGTWQLYDGTLNDQDLRSDLARFRQGVRVLVVSDNCGGGLPESPRSPGRTESRSCSHPQIEGGFEATILVLAACERGKYADGEGLPGHFAAAMTRVLTNFSGSYATFYEALCSEMPPYQRPDYYRLGPLNATFESQRPFAI